MGEKKFNFKGAVHGAGKNASNLSDNDRQLNNLKILQKI